MHDYWRRKLSGRIWLFETAVRTIIKRRPVLCQNIAAERPYFANYMINIQATALRDTSSEGYCPCDHYEYNNSSIWSFWSKIWAIEGPNYAQNSIFATVKIGFYHKFIRLLWQNYSFDRSDFFVVLDIGLMNVNPFLHRKYLINSWNGEKPRITLF